MKRLWIADVHANVPAFEAVVADAGPCDEVVFLGDVVGYGPHPAQCIDLLMGLGGVRVQGNHDAAVSAVAGRTTRYSPPVWDEWSFDQLNDRQKAFLAALPAQGGTDCCGVPARLTHHPAGAPYLHPAMPDEVLGQYVRPEPGTMLVCGHSHRLIDRSIGGGRFVCLPPVGQPRNGDPRAGYAIEQAGVLSFRYVAYDVERTAADTARLPLDAGFLERWLRFLRTARDPEWSREYKG